MVQVHRERSAERLNVIINDPAVRPWVADASEGALDVSRQVENEANVLLMGEHGGCMFFKLLPGVYEVHTQVLPEGRGDWTSEMTAAAVHWMFTRTDCYEIATRIPGGHIGARAAAMSRGLKHEFTRSRECRFRGKPVDVHIHSFRIQDWIREAPGLIEKGRWFHSRLHAEAKRLGIDAPPHTDDENHNRYVGAAYEMAVAGNWQKAVFFYNRWALLARHETVALISESPPMIKFDIGLLTLRDGEVEVTRAH